MESCKPRLTPILPCNDIDASERFFNRLGFKQSDEDKAKGENGEHDYRMLTNESGDDIHLTGSVEGWLVPGRNPFGLYLYVENVDEVATKFSDEIIERKKGPEHKPWGMYEFSLNAPDETLVRVGWPSRLMQEEGARK
jgi:catechol 2,3-dioxygenase-like lactoylglutathione lyase family enzyme